MEKILKGKKILFIGPIFYNYHTLLIEAFTEIGGDVDFVPEKEYGFMPKILDMSNPKLGMVYSNAKFLKKIAALKNKNYDYVFVIRGEYLNRNIIKELRQTFTEAKFIAYHWDSFRYNPNGLAVADLFDQVFSFDREDVSKNKGIIYKPLFYLETSSQEEHVIPVRDLLFIGVDYSDRYKIVKGIDSNCRKYNLKFDHYLITSIFSFYKKRMLRNADYKGSVKSDFVFSKINYEAFLTLTKESKAILDINYEGQAGLTMRTIEVLALGKKLITTNPFIKEELFYNPKVIHVIDRKNPAIDPEFIESEYEKVNMDEYNLKNWIKSFL